jgi:hypothetical protein
MSNFLQRQWSYRHAGNILNGYFIQIQLRKLVIMTEIQKIAVGNLDGFEIWWKSDTRKLKKSRRYFYL